MAYSSNLTTAITKTEAARERYRDALTQESEAKTKAAHLLEQRKKDWENNCVDVQDKLRGLEKDPVLSLLIASGEWQQTNQVVVGSCQVYDTPHGRTAPEWMPAEYGIRRNTGNKAQPYLRNTKNNTLPKFELLANKNEFRLGLTSTQFEADLEKKLNEVAKEFDDKANDIKKSLKAIV